MTVAEAQVAALRAFLTLDSDESAILVSRLGEEGVAGYLQLAEAALSVAAVQQFPHFSSADLVRFVATVRSTRITGGDEYDLDPALAESVLAYSLGRVDVRLPSPEQRVHVMFALLVSLTQERSAHDSWIDDLLWKARQLADLRAGGVLGSCRCPSRRGQASGKEIMYG